jgi:serine/threonine protein kinase
VQLLGLCKDDTGIYIVTEFIPGGDLRSKLKDDSLELSWLLRVKIAIDVAYAMNYLHSKKMIHRDLKSQNLLVRLALPRAWLGFVSDTTTPSHLAHATQTTATPTSS